LAQKKPLLVLDIYAKGVFCSYFKRITTASARQPSRLSSPPGLEERIQKRFARKQAGKRPSRSTTIDERAEYLTDIRLAENITFVSAEPLLGDINYGVLPGLHRLADRRRGKRSGGQAVGEVLGVLTPEAMHVPPHTILFQTMRRGAQEGGRQYPRRTAMVGSSETMRRGMLLDQQ
jgi:hypothetical protein